MLRKTFLLKVTTYFFFSFHLVAFGTDSFEEEIFEKWGLENASEIAGQVNRVHEFLAQGEQTLYTSLCSLPAREERVDEATASSRARAPQKPKAPGIRFQIRTFSSHSEEIESGGSSAAASSQVVAPSEVRKSSSKSTSSAKSPSTASTNAAIKWEGVNFALGSLLFMKTDGSYKEFPIGSSRYQEESLKAELDLYDSCFDRTHNFIPSLKECKRHWKR